MKLVKSTDMNYQSVSNSIQRALGVYGIYSSENRREEYSAFPAIKKYRK